MSSETEFLAQAVAAAIKEHFAQKFEAFAAQIKQLEDRFAATPIPKDGEPGKDAAPIDEDALVKRIMAMIPMPKDGEPGKDAPTIDEKALTANLLRDMSLRFEAAIAAIPKPKDGEPGANGEPGKDGLPGKDGEPGKDAQPIDESALSAKLFNDITVRLSKDLAMRLGAAVEAIPKPKDGEPGKDAPAVDEAAIVQRVSLLIPKPENGKPGEDAPPIDYLRLSQIIREEVDARVKLIPPAEKGEAGDPGKDGQDALEARILSGLDETRSYPRGTYAIHRNAFLKATRPTGPINGSVTDAGWQVLFAGPLAITAALGADDRTLELTTETAADSIRTLVSLPFPVDRGVWKQRAYQRGDCVSWNGSLWIARCDTERRPGDASPDWRLAVKQRSVGGPDAPMSS